MLNPGDMIKNIRTEKHMSQSGLAQLLDISPSHIAKVEAGMRSLGQDVIVSMAQALELPEAQSALIQAAFNYIPVGNPIDAMVAIAQLRYGPAVAERVRIALLGVSLD